MEETGEIGLTRYTMGYVWTRLTILLLRLRTFYARWKLVFRATGSMPTDPYRSVDMELIRASDRLEIECLRNESQTKQSALEGLTILSAWERAQWAVAGSLATLVTLCVPAWYAVPRDVRPARPSSASDDRTHAMDAGCFDDDRWLDGGVPAGTMILTAQPHSDVVIHPAIIEPMPVFTLTHRLRNRRWFLWRVCEVQACLEQPLLSVHFGSQPADPLPLPTPMRQDAYPMAFCELALRRD
jgi:hypothetical protein